MTFAPALPLRLPGRFPALAAAVAVLLFAAGAALWAQVAGDRGIAPVASSTDIEVRNVKVNVTGKNAEDARQAGWREAQRLAWKEIGGPEIPDARLESLVSAIVVQSENLGPRRYIATLGVIFDRARAGEMLGGEGERARSAPMLTLPLLVSGGTRTMFEVRNPWQRAWAEEQMGQSAIDYVRLSGAGGDSLLLTAGQAGRRSRAWWNEILDQYGAADVLVPVANLRWTYPGGPIDGRFTARYGPDNTWLGEFTLRARNDDALPAMMQQAVRRMDALYTQALAQSALQPDPTLELGDLELRPEILALIEAARRAEEAAAAPPPTTDQPAATSERPTAATPAPDETQTVASFTVQVPTADAPAIDAALASVRSAPGVHGVSTSSIAIGGISVLRVNFSGDASALALALRQRGWNVSQGGNTLSISR